MSPKSTTPKLLWENCSFCQSLVSLQESSQHLEIYHEKTGTCVDKQSTPKSRPTKQPKESICSGYIRQTIIHAGVKDFINRDKVDMTSLQIDGIILLHPNAMSMCRISIGSWVIVWRNDKFVFLKAWPINNLSHFTNSIVSKNILKLLSCEMEDSIHVKKIECQDLQPVKYVEMVLKDDQNISGKTEFIKYLKSVFEGQLISEGSSLYINYLGQDYFLKVKTINNNSNISNESNSEENICAPMEKLQLKNEDESSINSTPKKSCQLKNFCYCENTLPEFSLKKVYFHSKTKLKIITNRNSTESKQNTKHVITLDDVGGLNDEISKIQQILNLPVENKTFKKYGYSSPKGILLFGPSGTGKSLIVEAIKNLSNYSFLTINGPECFSKYYGETESRLRAVFEDAKQQAPAIIFIDKINALCGKRNGQTSRQEYRVSSTLLSLMDKIDGDERIIVLATCNDLDSVDPDIRRAGRLDQEIEIGVPTEIDRTEILTKILKRIKHLLSDDDIKNVARILHGFVGVDIVALCGEARSCSYKRCGNENITHQDMINASKLIKPSAMREILLDVPNVRWDDVGGQDNLKSILKQAVEWPIKFPEKMKRMGISSSKGVLMYGPPGCSKTLIAKALATESGLNFIAIKGPEIFNKWVGESERAVREIFRKARSVAPSILFFDEIDSVASHRGNSAEGSNVDNRVISELLVQMDGLQELKGVIIVAATNRPDKIDSALLRPGRFDRHVYVPLPDLKTREAIFKIAFKKRPISSDVSIDYLAQKTDGFSGAEIINICEEASLKALEESFDIKEIRTTHFEKALESLSPRTPKQMIQFFEDYQRKQMKNIF